ncbi:MAG: HAD family hydrolase, partial [Pygmaiobacter sp.]
MGILDVPFDPALILQKKRSLKRELSQKDGLTPKKIALLSGSTIGEIKNILEVFLLNYGIRPEFYEGEYSLFYENLLFDDGSLKSFAPDFVYLHTTRKNLRHLPSVSDSPDIIADGLEADWAHFKSAFDAAAALGCP